MSGALRINAAFLTAQGRTRVAGLVLAWVLAVLVGLPAQAAGPQPEAPSRGASPSAAPPAEAFFGPEEFGSDSATVSPSGRWLAVAIQPATLRRGLAVYDLEGKQPPYELVRFSDIDIATFHWVSDERLIFDVVDQGRGSGDQRLDSGLFSIRRDGTEMRQLILMQWWSRPASGTQASRRLDASHDLVFVPPRQTLGQETVIVKGARNPNQWSGDWVLKRLNIVTGQVEALNAAEPTDVSSYWFDPQGQPVLATGAAHGKLRVYERKRDAQGGLINEWKTISEGDSLALPWVMHSVDQAGRIYVLQHEGASGEGVLKRFDRASNKPVEPALLAVPGFDFKGRLIEEAAEGQDPVLGVRVLAEASTTAWFHPEMAAIQKAVDARLPGRTNVLSCRRCREANRTVIVSSGSDRHPGELWLWKGSADSPRAWRRLGISRPKLPPQHMGEMHLARFAARDGLAMPLWLTLPPAAVQAAEQTTPRPAVVLVHGGPWVRGVSWQWSAMAQFIASRGYVVLEPEFRGSAGYGQKLFKAGWKQWGRAMQDDLADAVQWAVKRGLVDPKRVCIAGGSYGGYAALMGLARQADTFACGASWVPLTDIWKFLRQGSRDDWTGQVRLHVLPQLLADSNEDPAAIDQISPVSLADRITAPLLLAWSEEDRRTPPEHAKALRQLLEARGRPPQAVGYEGEGHGWLKTATRVDFAQRLEAFLATSLKPAAEATRP